MKYIEKIIILTAFSLILFASCDDEYDFGSPKQSTPVIESAGIEPSTFIFGDTVTLNAKITDPATTLTTLEYQIKSGDKVISTGSIPISGGSTATVSNKILIPLTPEQSDNAQVVISLTANNVLKGFANRDITGLTGKRPVYEKLYLVTDDGFVVELLPQSTNKDIYERKGLSLEHSMSYKIAEKVTSDKQIDYSGTVWGNVNGKISTIDEKGESAFVHAVGYDFLNDFLFDNLKFSVDIAGINEDILGEDDIFLSKFGEAIFDGEFFRTYECNLVKNREYTVFGALVSEKIVYNLDYFERTAHNKVKFLGETGDYTLYYNTYRQHVILWVDGPAYPDYLPITGGGIGYPTKVLSGEDRAHCWWGFGNPRNFILPRKIADNVFQATIFIHDDPGWVGLKPFENTGWGGEKGFDVFTITGEDIFDGNDGNNFIPNNNIDSDAIYRLTFNWANNTLNVEKMTL